MAFDADRFLKVAAGSALLAVGGGVGFYYGVHLPGLAAQKEEAKQTESEQRRNRYNICISNADNEYSFHWDSECDLLKKEKDCALPGYASSRVERFREENKERCMEEFKAGV
jgi:hypothetical protein